MKYQLFSVDPESPDRTVLIEERQGDDPLDFLFGERVVVHNVETVIEGEEQGFRAVVSIDPSEAFGPYRPDLMVTIPKDKFPKEVELKLGMKFQTQGPEGQVLSVVIKDIQESGVLVDGNHPLAGLGLKFELEILRVRIATTEEIAKKEVITVLH